LFIGRNQKSNQIPAFCKGKNPICYTREIYKLYVFFIVGKLNHF